MQEPRQEILRKAASRGKYAPLYQHLKSLDQEEWRASFAEIEALLGFSLPDSARIHRPWWANQGQSGGHSHALSWQVAGWKTSQVDLVGERVVFVRNSSAGVTSETAQAAAHRVPETTMNKIMIEEVWTRIRARMGEEFHTKTGMPFKFEISGDVFRPSRTEYSVSRSDFGKALKLVPFDGPGVVNRLVRGPSYVWAVLHDQRIRQQDW